MPREIPGITVSGGISLSNSVMKSKKLTYGLILSVIAVWGIIFYRIYVAAQGEESFAGGISYPKSSYEPLDDYKIKDTFTLALNYRDPFLGEAAKTEEPSASASAVPAVANFAMNPVPSKPPVNWEVIRYTGYIVNPGIKKAVAIMNINGKEYMMSEGEKADGVMLLKSFRDSVKVSYQDKIKFIKVQ